MHAHVAGLDSSGKNHDSTKLPKASICLQDILQDCTVRGGRRRKSMKEYERVMSKARGMLTVTVVSPPERQRG